MKNLLKTSFFNIIFKFASLILIFLYQSLMSKLIDINIYGAFSKFLVYSNYFSLFFSFGLSASIIHYSNNIKEFISYWKSSIFLYFTIIFVSILFEIVIKFNIYKIFIYIIFGNLLNIITILLSYYQFKLYFIKYALFNLIQALLIVSNLIILYFFIFIRTNTFFIITLYIFSNVIFILIIFVDIFKQESIFSIKTKFDKKLFKYGIKIVSLIILSQFIYFSDYLLIDFFLDNIHLAYYFVSMITAKIIFVFADTFGNIIFTLYSNKKINNNIIDKNVYIVSSTIFGISIFLFIVFYFFGRNIINFFYTENYQMSYVPTLLLILGTQGMIIYKLLSRKIVSLELWKILYKSLIIAVTINILLNIILIPRYGINGAAFSSMLSYWICGIILVYMSGEKLINFLFFYKRYKN